MTDLEHILNRRVERLENTMQAMQDDIRQQSLRMDTFDARLHEMSHLLEMVLKSQQRIEKALGITL